MVTFIDEWRRKFPSCMVVKRLINRFVFETVNDRNRHLTFFLLFFRCRSSWKNTGWVNIATMVQLSSFNWSREMYLSKPLCLQAFFAFLCATDWRETWSSACLESRRSRVFSPTLAFQFQRNEMFLTCSLVKVQYCAESPWMNTLVFVIVKDRNCHLTRLLTAPVFRLSLMNWPSKMCYFRSSEKCIMCAWFVK